MSTGKFLTVGHTRGMSRTDSHVSNTQDYDDDANGAEGADGSEQPFPRPEAGVGNAEKKSDKTECDDGAVQLAPGSEISEHLASGSQSDRQNRMGQPSRESERDMLRVGSTGLGGMARAVRTEDSEGDPFDDAGHGAS